MFLCGVETQPRAIALGLCLYWLMNSRMLVAYLSLFDLILVETLYTIVVVIGLARPDGPFGLVSARMSLTETHVVSGSSFWRDSCNQAKTHLGPLGLVLVRYMDPRHMLLDVLVAFLLLWLLL